MNATRGERSSRQRRLLVVDGRKCIQETKAVGQPCRSALSPWQWEEDGGCGEERDIAVLGALLFVRRDARRPGRPTRSRSRGDRDAVGAVLVKLWQVVDLVEGLADLMADRPAVAIATARKVGSELRSKLLPAEVGELERAAAARRVRLGL